MTTIVIEYFHCSMTRLLNHFLYPFTHRLLSLQKLDELLNAQHENLQQQDFAVAD